APGSGGASSIASRSSGRRLRKGPRSATCDDGPGEAVVQATTLGVPHDSGDHEAQQDRAHEGTDRAHPEHPVGELALSDLEAAYPKVAQTVPERRAEKHDEHEVLRGEHPERRERVVVEERRRDERAGEPG